MNNISERLRFLINTQSPPAEGEEKRKQGLSKMLAPLERITGISQSKWRNLMRGQIKAGEEMIEAAIKLWPWHAEWLTTGGLLGIEQKIPALKQAQIDWCLVVCELSQRQGWSQEAIAEYLGVTQNAVVEWSTGKRPVPMLHRVRLAGVVGLEKTDFLLEEILPDDVAVAWNELNK